MGFMQKLLGFKTGNAAIAQDGSAHNINKGSALAHTNGKVHCPQNANFDTVRTAPVVESPRFFTINEANALVQLADQKETQAKQTVVAYHALERIEDADTKVHRTHRRYQGKVSRNELSKVESNAQYAKELHGQRPRYEQLGQQVNTAEKKANSAIEAIRATYGA